MLQQPQLAGARHGFGAPLDLQLVKDDASVALDRAQSQEQPIGDLLVREPWAMRRSTSNSRGLNGSIKG